VEDISSTVGDISSTVGDIFNKQSLLGADNTRNGSMMDMLPIDITEVQVVPAQAVPVVPVVTPNHRGT
jgi:hypothetical protein